MIARENIRDLYPLSPMQEGMLFHALENPESNAYFEQVSWRVSGPLRPAVFEQAWNYLFDRHDILRTAFLHERTKRPVQVVLKKRAMPVSVEDLTHLTPAAQDTAIAAGRVEEKRRGFDLREEPLLRARIIVLGPDRFEVTLSFHHILMDGWCMGILNAEFLAVYEAICAGHVPSLPSPVPYRHYIQWLERQDKEETLQHWESRLRGFDNPTVIPGQRTHSGEYTLDRLHAELDVEKTARLTATASAWGVTSGNLFQAAWAIVLSRYADSDDVVFGAIVSGRPAEVPNAEKILGLFINLIPVRARLGANDTARTLARAIHADFLDALPHMYCPIGEVAARCGFSRGLVDHIVAVENYPSAQSSSTGLLQVELTDRFEQTNYNLALVVAPGERTEVAFHFNSSAFDAGYIRRLLTNYLRALDLMTADPLLREMDILPPEETQTPAARDSPVVLPHLTLTANFEARAAAYPEALAVEDEGVRWSFGELSARAQAVADLLFSRGIQPEDRVAVMIPRSRWLVLSLVGILKAGAAYLPIDPADPAERIRFFLEDSGAKCLLTAGPSETGIDITALKPASETRRSPEIHPERLAYAIYTSGSTGQPKAVAISHVAAMNLVRWHVGAFGLTAESRSTIFASPAFDASLWEILPSLIAGASLYPVPQADRLDPERLLAFLSDKGISHTFVPTAVAEELSRAGGMIPRSLTILTGGDALRRAEGFGGHLYNNYGPTECAVVATSIRIERDGQTIPIGRPIDNTEILILDSQCRPRPIGTEGELCIASRSLARGYLNRPSLTAERFVPHPWKAGQRMYRTGDMGYWRDRGTPGSRAIFFAGRNDRQLKVNGIRIEPGEIESILESHAYVSEAAVGLRGNRVIAWITGTANPSELARFASERLAAALTPAEFIFVPEMPRTRNGKLDRAALHAAGSAEQTHRAPSTPTETELAAIWSEVLGVEGIGLDDDFFALGGHSLKVTRAVSRIRDKFSTNLPLRALFEAPTIARLAAVLEAKPASDVSAHPEPALIARPRRILTTSPQGKGL